MIVALTFLTAGLLAAPVPLTDADRTALVTELKASQQAVVDTVKGLTPEQMTFKPGPDRWSVAECVEHIAATEPMLFGFIEGKVLKTRARERSGSREDGRQGHRRHGRW